MYVRAFLVYLRVLLVYLRAMVFRGVCVCVCVCVCERERENNTIFREEITTRTELEMVHLMARLATADGLVTRLLPGRQKQEFLHSLLRRYQPEYTQLFVR